MFILVDEALFIETKLNILIMSYRHETLFTFVCVIACEITSLCILCAPVHHQHEIHVIGYLISQLFVYCGLSDMFVLRKYNIRLCIFYLTNKLTI